MTTDRQDAGWVYQTVARLGLIVVHSFLFINIDATSKNAWLGNVPLIFIVYYCCVCHILCDHLQLLTERYQSVQDRYFLGLNFLWPFIRIFDLGVGGYRITKFCTSEANEILAERFRNSTDDHGLPFKTAIIFLNDLSFLLSNILAWPCACHTPRDTY
jgi:hypothetical protein